MKTKYAVLAIAFATFVGYAFGHRTTDKIKSDPLTGNTITITRPDGTSPSGWSSTRIFVTKAKRIGNEDWLVMSDDPKP